MIDRTGVSRAIKRSYGAVLRPQWLEQCAEHIETELGQAVKDGKGVELHLEAQIRLVLEQLLDSDIGESCYPGLVVDADSRRVSGLPGGAGAFLQIQEVMDIGVSKHAMWEAVREKEDFEQCGIRPSYLPARDEGESDGVFTAGGTQHSVGEPTASECGADGEREAKIPRLVLKVELTDGKTRISGVELTRIPQLRVELPVGTKVVVSGGRFLEATGMLILSGGGIRVLGGTPPHYKQHTLRARLESLLRMGSHLGTDGSVPARASRAG
ncbi:recQ-mediated genome instability protein 1 [Coemansia sp. RSA 1365]|nr:recQ-mediated genome instability protein 1 [Coemansia sp. RSA 1365]